MAFLLAFSELTVSALLWTAGTETIGVVLYNLEEAGLASQASAVAVVIVAVVTVAMLALDALGQYLPEGTLPWHCETDATTPMAKAHGQVHAGSEKAERFEPAPALGA
jgi:iron(III) transport system permease protein